MDENPYKAPTAEKKPTQWRRVWSVLFVAGILLSLSPAIGMLMTVAGMVSSFNQIATKHEQPRPEDLAAGVSAAMNFTFVGLAIAPIGAVIAVVSAIKLWRRKPPA